MWNKDEYIAEVSKIDLMSFKRIHKDEYKSFTAYNSYREFWLYPHNNAFYISFHLFSLR